MTGTVSTMMLVAATFGADDLASVQVVLVAWILVAVVIRIRGSPCDGVGLEESQTF